MEKLRRGIDGDLDPAEFFLRAFFDFAAKKVGHQLRAIANAEDRLAKIKDLWIDGRRFLQVTRVGPAGENEAENRRILQIFDGGGAGEDLAINVDVADSAGDQLVVLTAEIENDDSFFCHGFITRLCPFYKGRGRRNLFHRKSRLFPPL